MIIPIIQHYYFRLYISKCSKCNILKTSSEYWVRKKVIFNNLKLTAYNYSLYYLATKIVKQFKKRQPMLKITDSDVLCVQIAALCLNLDYGPFSHIFNELFMNRIKGQKDWKVKFWFFLFHNFKKNWYKSIKAVKMFQHMIENNNLPFAKYLDNSKEGIEFIEMLISGTPSGLQAQRVCYHFHYHICHIVIYNAVKRK